MRRPNTSINADKVYGINLHIAFISLGLLCFKTEDSCHGAGSRLRGKRIDNSGGACNQFSDFASWSKLDLPCSCICMKQVVG